METRALLQFLVVMWAGLTSAQDSILFPGDVANETVTHPAEASNRFQPIPPPLRTNARPSCSLRAGADQDSPCENDEEYDESVRSYIQDILTQTGLNSLVGTQLFKDLLKDDIVDTRAGGVGFRTGSVGTRISGVSETPVCQAEETLIFPKRAKSLSNDWVFVLNQDNVEQAVRVEKCINEGSACEFGSPLPVQTFCRQKYVYRRLLTVGSNKIQPEEVLMPSCCVCYRRFSDFDIGSRTRFSNGNGQPMSPVNPTTVPFNPTQPASQPFNPGQPTGQPFNPIQPTGQPFIPFGQPARSNMAISMPAPPLHFHNRAIRRRDYAIVPAIRRRLPWH